MLSVGEQVSKLRQELAEDVPAEEIDTEQWERARHERDRRFRVVPEGNGIWRVLGRGIERMCVQTDWENEDAIIYLQHRLSRIGVDDALEKAGCRAGDEVRITGYSFAYEGALDDFEDEEPEDTDFITETSFDDGESDE